MKVLITGGNSAKAMKLIKAFENEKIIFSDYGNVPFLKTNHYQFISLGVLDEINIVHSLLKTCLDEGIDIIIPLYTFEIEALSNSETLFQEFNILILLPSLSDFLPFDNQEDNSNDLIIIKDGHLFYSNSNTFDIDIISSKGILNGVFHFSKNHLYLFKI